MRIAFVPRAGQRARAVFVVALLLAAGCNRLSSSDVHRVGHLAPRTGPDPAAGLHAGEAVAMTVEDFNVDEANRIDKKAVSVIHGDTGPDLDGFAFQATRLLTVNRVEALLGAPNAAQLDKLAMAAQSGQVVLVTPSGGSAGSVNRLVFCVGLDPKERGRCLAKYAAEDRPEKVAEIALVTSVATPLYAAITEGFTREFQHADRKIGPEYIYHDRRELDDLVARLGRTKPPALFFAGPVGDLLVLRKEVKNPPVFFGGEEDEPALRLNAEPCEGIVFTTAFTTESMKPNLEQFATKFKNRYRQQTPEADDVLSADAARILFDAAKKAGTFDALSHVEKDPNLRRDGLTKLEEYQCLTGPFWFTPDQTARRTVFVVQMQGGRSKLLKDYAPEKK